MQIRRVCSRCKRSLSLAGTVEDERVYHLLTVYPYQVKCGMCGHEDEFRKFEEDPDDVTMEESRQRILKELNTADEDGNPRRKD